MEFSNQDSLEAASVAGAVISVMAILVALVARRFGLRRLGVEVWPCRSLQPRRDTRRDHAG